MHHLGVPFRSCTAAEATSALPARTHAPVEVNVSGPSLSLPLDTEALRRVRVGCRAARKAFVAASLPRACAGTGFCSPCGALTSLRCEACPTRRRVLALIPDDGERGERLAAYRISSLCLGCRDDEDVRCCLSCLDVLGHGSDDPFRGGFHTWDELAALGTGAAASTPPDGP